MPFWETNFIFLQKCVIMMSQAFSIDLLRAFVQKCLVWFWEESVITFICHQRAGKNRGKKPPVTLVTNWAFLIKTETKQKSLKQSNRKRKLMLR